MAQDYEPDEFDQIASEGGPVGVHRAPRPWWTRLLPPVLAFLIAGLLALGIAMLLWNQDIVGPDANHTPTVTVTPPAEQTPEPEATDTPVTESPEPEATAEPEDSPEPEPEPEPTETAEPEPEILRDAQVHVRNGASIQGLAGAQQELLETAGYTNIEANNIDASLIPGGTNVVAYTDERLADTAQDIADALGIDAVEGGTTPGGAEIEVLLATDPGA